MKDRIRQLMESMHMNQQTFANHIHIGTATLSSILLGRTKPTLNTVEAIQKHCPTVNLSWLINGQGDMFASPEPPIPSDGNPDELQSGDNVRDLFTSSNNVQSSGVSVAQPLSGTNSQGAESAQRMFNGQSSPVVSGSSRSSGMMGQQRVGRQQVQNFAFDTKNIDKYTRHITEIRVYYDDQTWETFVPKK